MREIIDVVMIGGFVLFMLIMINGFYKQRDEKITKRLKEKDRAKK